MLTGNLFPTKKSTTDNYKSRQQHIKRGTHQGSNTSRQQHKKSVSEQHINKAPLKVWRFGVAGGDQEQTSIIPSNRQQCCQVI